MLIDIRIKGQGNQWVAAVRVDGQQVASWPCDDPASGLERSEQALQQRLGAAWDPDQDEGGTQPPQNQGDSDEQPNADGDQGGSESAHGAQQAPAASIPTMGEMWQQEAQNRIQRRVTVHDMGS